MWAARMGVRPAVSDAGFRAPGRGAERPKRSCISSCHERLASRAKLRRRSSDLANLPFCLLPLVLTMRKSKDSLALGVSREAAAEVFGLGEFAFLLVALGLDDPQKQRLPTAWRLARSCGGGLRTWRICLSACCPWSRRSAKAKTPDRLASRAKLRRRSSDLANLPF